MRLRPAAHLTSARRLAEAVLERQERLVDGDRLLLELAALHVMRLVVALRARQVDQSQRSAAGAGRDEAHVADGVGARGDGVGLRGDGGAEGEPRLERRVQLGGRGHAHRPRAARAHVVVLVRAEGDGGTLGQQVDAALGGDLEEDDLDRAARPGLHEPVHLAPNAPEQRAHRVGLPGARLPVEQGRRVRVAAQHPLDQRLQHAVAHVRLARRGVVQGVRAVPAMQHAQAPARAREPGVVAYEPRAAQ